jgi:hypothetical protein
MSSRSLAAICFAAILATTAVGCSHTNASSEDQSINQAVQSKINADPALSGAAVTASTLNGVVTLKGSVASEAARQAAAADAQMPGVTQVDNQIGTNTPSGNAMSGATAPAGAMSGAAASAGAMSGAPASAGAMSGAPAPRRRRASNSSASSASAPAPAIQAVAPVQVDTGTPLEVRLNAPLSSATASAGQGWSGTLAQAVRVNGQIAIPRGSTVTGQVVAVDSAGHFKGQSRLVLDLTTLDYNGQSYGLTTSHISRLAASRGKRSAIAIGGGAALGALVGALVGHGKGAAIGAASGAGAGTAAEALTKPAEVNLPAETALRFTLSAPVQVVPAASVH